MILESFSAGYWILPEVEITTYGGKRAIIQDDVFFDLVSETGLDPVIASAGGGHFPIYPERSIPDRFVAVPEDSRFAARDGDAVLIAKQNGREVFQYG